MEELDDVQEQALADLLAELTDQVARGERVDFDGVCRDHPELAAALKSVWGAVLLTDVAGVAADQATNMTALKPASPALWRVGDYELQEELGRGGMGVVYRARQVSLGRTVAVKMLARGSAASAEELERFRGEATAAARLEHPNIVRVFDFGDFEGRPFFAMQLIRGKTLAELIQDEPLHQRKAAALLAKVARAVDYAHRRGVLHRDLKPSNILLDEHGQPHVSDFGLAKQVTAGDASQLTRSGAVLGTPSYMSPEQASGRRGLRYGPASDVYSLGAVLYHALVGRPPLVADTPVDTVLKVLEQEPSAPRSLRPEIDRDLEMIIIRCLQKPYDLRYATAGELADDLEAFLNDEPVAARSGRFVQVLSRWFRDTHHANVLENWGLLWMWHAVVLLIASLLTWCLQVADVQSYYAYAGVWTFGLGLWAAVFWALRQRLGPVTFVERQIAHVWASSMISIAALFPLEWWLDLPVLTLSPLVAVSAAMVFLIKASIFSGTFYLQCVSLLLTSLLMAASPMTAHLLFGVVAALCFWIPGQKYYRQRYVD